MTSTGLPARDRPDGVVLVSIWFILKAVVLFLGAAVILLLGVRVLMRDTAGSPDGDLVLVATFFGLFVVVVLGVLELVAALGMLRLRDWARWLAIGLVVPGLILIPVGTIIGGVIIWYLLTDKVKQAFGVAVLQPTAQEPITAAQPDQPTG